MKVLVVLRETLQEEANPAKVLEEKILTMIIQNRLILPIFI